jgi:NTE family protein
MFFKAKRPKIGLALGSGGPRGLAHIGIIKVLEQHNIPIDYIAGSSIGAVVGGFYAAKKNIAEIEQMAVNTKWKQYFSMFFDPSFGQGLIKGDKIAKFMDDYLENVNFHNLKIPFKAVATNVKDGETVIIDKGRAVDAIRVSLSIPLLFKPINIDNQLLVDGGLSMPVPVDVVRKMGADVVIAVNLNTDCLNYSEEDKIGFYKIANNSVVILEYHLARENCKTANIVIEPKVGCITWKKFLTGKAGEEGIAIGEQAAQAALPHLKKLALKPQHPLLNRLANFFQNLKKSLFK